MKGHPLFNKGLVREACQPFDIQGSNLLPLCSIFFN